METKCLNPSLIISVLWCGVVWWRVAWRDFGVRGGVGVGLARRGMVWRAVAWFGVVRCGVGGLERSGSETGTPWKEGAPRQRKGFPHRRDHFSTKHLAAECLNPMNKKQQLYHLFLLSHKKTTFRSTQKYLQVRVQDLGGRTRNIARSMSEVICCMFFCEYV